MAALQYSKYSKALKSPMPEKDEILVKIEATMINLIDWKLQKGMLKIIYLIKLPYIPCSDVSGKVVSIGPSITGFSQGDKVVSWLDLNMIFMFFFPFSLESGGFAQYAISAIKYMTKRPSRVPIVKAAALSLLPLVVWVLMLFK
ncbi:hypothetical protein SELMODRAFT_403171 [Selaginella moellendorffii]|uniref:Alcohol dehydrogenase-like N-terminal domain-containing protein n=1 Tax=Selaginella moellendorffii TaxID=88036 RepID=D8QTB6_SELML|nr:hypothetical protein SELMODRAFT_403171 [Selaginella moellendorffii]